MKDNQIKVSIIVPVYNTEKYLDRCMESLLGQTLRELEIIVVDDGSGAACAGKCDQWGKKDERIRVIHKKNQGLDLQEIQVCRRRRASIWLSLIPMTMRRRK